MHRQPLLFMTVLMLAAAAGCKIPGMGERDADALATLIADAVAKVTAA